jgi:hypothetical protein
MAPSGSHPVPQRTPSGMVRPNIPQTVMASGSQPMAARRPSGAVAVASGDPGRAPMPSGFVSTDNVSAVPFAHPEPKKKSSAGVVGAAVVVLLAGGGAAAFVMFKKPQVEPVAAITPSPSTTPVPAARPDPTPVPVPAGPEMLSVIVDTEPPQAKILDKDNVRIGETPEEVKVAKGTTVKVTLKKDGYLEETIEVDPSKGHKMVVKLDRAHSSGSHKTAATVKPVYSMPANTPAKQVGTPLKNAPLVTPTVTPPKKKASSDPYERLDDAPSTPSKKSREDVLNPY